MELARREARSSNEGQRMSRAAAAPTSAKATACLGRLPPLRGGRKEARGEAATTCAGRFVGHETQHPLSRRARERWAFEAKSSRVVYGAIKNEESYTLELTEENVETVLDEVRRGPASFSPASLPLRARKRASERGERHLFLLVPARSASSPTSRAPALIQTDDARLAPSSSRFART